MNFLLPTFKAANRAFYFLHVPEVWIKPNETKQTWPSRGIKPHWWRVYYTFTAQFGGRHEDLSHSKTNSGWDKSSCLPNNRAINCLLCRKLKHGVIQRRALCHETRQGNTTSGGKHDDLSSLHETSLDQSHFFIRHINFMMYDNLVYYRKVVFCNFTYVEKSEQQKWNAHN